MAKVRLIIEVETHLPSANMEIFNDGLEATLQWADRMLHGDVDITGPLLISGEHVTSVRCEVVEDA